MPSVPCLRSVHSAAADAGRDGACERRLPPLPGQRASGHAAAAGARPARHAHRRLGHEEPPTRHGGSPRGHRQSRGAVRHRGGSLFHPDWIQ